MNINFLAVKNVKALQCESGLLFKPELTSDTSGGGYIPPFK